VFFRFYYKTMMNHHFIDPKNAPDQDIADSKQHLPAAKDSNGPDIRQSDESTATILPADQSEFVDNNNTESLADAENEKAVNNMIPEKDAAPQGEIVNGQENDFPEAEEGYFNKE